jgi:four helix bundle protein
MATFKELDVFQRSVLMVKYIYGVTKHFPESERQGMVSQLQRASISIPASLAEGTSRRTINDKQYYVDLALGALNEVYAQLLVAKEMGYIPEAEIKRFERGYDALRPKLIAYQRSIEGIRN